MTCFPNKENGRAADTPYMFWAELRTLFQNAYAPPRNDSLIKRVYEYAAWCDQQPRGKTAEDDLLTATAVCFYEHLPENPATRADMPRWFTRQQIQTMKALLRYRISEEDYQNLLKLFPPKPPTQRSRRAK